MRRLPIISILALLFAAMGLLWVITVYLWLCRPL